MSSGTSGFLAELRRRRVFRVAAVYIVAAWIVIQVAGEAFPAMEVPESTIRYVWLAVILGFPLVLVFGWRFDIVGGRIAHTPGAASTPGADLSLQRADYIILAGLTLVAGSIIFGLTREIFGALTKPEVLVEESAPERSIAVLPFENISKDEINGIFTDGIHDDLLTQLAKVSTLKVISGTSVRRYRQTSKSAPQIASELRVATLLEGSVQRYGSKIRINVQLIDARSDEHMWAKTYDRDLTARSVYAIQTEIAESITLALDSALTAKDRERLENTQTDSMDAYYAYLLGRQRMINRNSTSLQQAAEFFRKAIELDPEYAIAHVGLANVYMLLGDYGNLSLTQMLSKALPAVNAAMRLDDNLAEAHASMGAIMAKTGNYAAAEASFERAIMLDPNYSTAYHWYGDILVNLVGRPLDAVPILKRALELDPLSPAINLTLGQAFEGIGHFDDAMSQYTKTIEIEPTYASPYLLIAGLYRYAFGQFDEAMRWRFKGMARDPGNALALSVTGFYYLDLGDDAAAEYWIDRALALAPEQYAPNRALAFLYRYRGEAEQALVVARKLREISPGNNDSLVIFIAFDRFLEALEEYSRIYPELLCDGEPDITRSNVFQALNLSLALERTGNNKCATFLLHRILELLQTMPRLGAAGYGIADVEVYARLGKRNEALASLRQAIDDHYRAFWWAQGERSPHTELLRDDREFIALMQEIKEDLAAQLVRIRRMQATGELTELPRQ